MIAYIITDVLNIYVDNATAINGAQHLGGGAGFMVLNIWVFCLQLPLNTLMEGGFLCPTFRGAGFMVLNSLCQQLPLDTVIRGLGL